MSISKKTATDIVKNINSLVKFIKTEGVVINHE